MASSGVISELYVNITSSLTALQARLRNAFSLIKGFAQDTRRVMIGTLAADAFKAGLRGLINTASGLAGYFATAIENASDLNEALSKTNATLGKSAAGAIAFANSMEERGVSSAKSVLDSFTNTFSALRNQGFTDDEAFKYAERLEERMSDIASQRNLTNEQTRDTLRSMIAGQFDSGSTIGVFTNAEQLDARVAASGRGGTATPMGARKERVREMMNEIMRQSASAKGDFDATRYSYSNQKKTGDIRAQAVSTRIGQDLLLVGQAFQYFRNRFLATMLQIANTGAFKRLGEIFTQIVSYLGSSLETVLPAIVNSLVSFAEKLAQISLTIATFAAALMTQPQTVLGIIKNVLLIAGYGLADTLNLIANKLSLGLVARDDRAGLKAQAGAEINAGMEAIKAQAAGYEVGIQAMIEKFKSASGQSAAAALTPQQQLSEGVKSSRSSLNSMLDGVFGNERAYQNTMQNLTRQIAENTKPKEMGATNVTGPRIAQAAPAFAGGL